MAVTEPGGIEERVAAQEAAISAPVSPAEHWTDEQVAVFQAQWVALSAKHDLRVIPPKPPLTPDEIRQLLRECVTGMRVRGSAPAVKAPDRH